MGLLQNGKWVDKWYDTSSTGGRFMRKDSQFRNWVTVDGKPGPTGKGGFKATAGRYHLYVSLACPWAHRTLIFRSLKGLEKMVSISVVNWYMAENGWTFKDGEGVIGDTENQADYLYKVYTKADKSYSGRVTVPILWDKELKTIVSNESSEIIRMFNSEFEKLGANTYDYYPEELRSQIGDINKRIYETLNNGVYRCGFSTTQEAYDEAVIPLFETLDWIETILSAKNYLAGDTITEADWRLFTTLIRFDPVYVGHFKCNIKRISDYSNISKYMLNLYNQPGIAETVNMEHIKKHYYQSHETLNPSRIVPMGPENTIK